MRFSTRKPHIANFHIGKLVNLVVIVICSKAWRKCQAANVSSKDATILPISKEEFQCTLVQKTRVHAIRKNPLSKFQSSGMIHGLLWTFRRRVLRKEPTRRSFSTDTSSRSVPSIWMNKNFQEPSTWRSVQTRKKINTCFLTFWYILYRPSLSSQLYFWFLRETLNLKLWKI